MWKWIVGVLVVLVVLTGAAGVAVWRSGVLEKMGGGAGPVGVEVSVGEVERGDLIRTVSAPGSIEPVTLVKISSQVSAKVEALPFREGQQVRAGDVVVRLDPQDLTAILESAQASLRSEEARLLGAQAGLINARLNYERLSSLHESGDVTSAELESAEASYLQAQSNLRVIEHTIEAARARIDQAQKDLDNTVIASPIDGVVTALNTEVGETVIVGTTNNPGSVIMEIADLEEMIVEAQVDESNIAPVKVGQSARVFVNAYPDREFTGTVRQIGLKRQVAADGTGYFEVEILVNTEEGDRLYSGLTASVDVAVEEFFDVLRVPSQAVLDRRVEDLPDEVVRDNPYVDRSKTFARVVFRMVEGKAVATPVQVSASDLTHTIVAAGVSAGDRVVVGPYRVLGEENNPLQHGQAIRDRDDKAQDAAPEAQAAAEEGEAVEESAGEESADADSSDGAGEGSEEDASVAGTGGERQP